MKRLILLAVLLLIWLPTVMAVNTTLYQGVYDFEDYAASGMTWSGTWTTSTFASQVYRSSVDTSAFVTFDAQGDFLQVYFLFYSSATAGTFDICHNDGTACVTFNQGSSGLAQQNQKSVIYSLAGSGTPLTVKINVDSTTRLYLDYLMILDDGPDYTATPPNTPVPTATILPSSTPGVPTATILPSSTPGVPTATILPSSTPPNTPVDTATAVPTATPPNTPVPTATILPSSTPGVPTATILPSSTPANTPVDTPTEISFPPTPTEITFLPTPTEIDIDAIETLIALFTPVSATPTFTPTITNTPTPEPRACWTLEPGDETPEGQLACFDYTATAADVHTANLLLMVFISIWGFFLFGIFVVWRTR